MESFSEHLKIAHSAESLETKENEAVENHLRLLQEDLRVEIERMVKEETPFGEGRAGQVFDLELPHSQYSSCIKVWRPELQTIRRHSLIEYRKIQAIDPEEEFDLQDELYMDGFTNIARPLAYAYAGDWHTMAMEKIVGHTLQQIIDKDAKVSLPAWKKLYDTMFRLNKKHGVVHRDLHPGNIILKTDQELIPGAMIEGELYILDFGLAKKIFGSPSDEDFILTIGNDVVKFPQDKSLVENLKPVFSHEE